VIQVLEFAYSYVHSIKLVPKDLLNNPTLTLTHSKKEKKTLKVPLQRIIPGIETSPATIQQVNE